MTIKTILLVFIFTIIIANKASAQDNEKIDILLVGFDHLSQMDNGTATSDIFSSKKQKEIILLTEKLKSFAADMILVEKEASEQKTLDSLYRSFVKGNIQLSNIENGASETFQVGFRLARMLQLNRVFGIDHYESTSQSLLDSGKNIDVFKNGLGALINIARPLKKSVQKDSLSIYEYIKIMNQPEMINLSYNALFNLPAYVIEGEFSENGTNTVDIGSIDNRYIGAEYITLFYNRNLKIYSNILNTQLDQNSKRIILIMGQLHIGVLMDLLKHNSRYNVRDISDYLD
ncbi:DUF5694 domain-containing protein [Sediminibacter sp. Hel_I_10]|uniref:DUF5694 domain-containing protein n=1 Tax=Sediminibacter sp. Hel_I_10 TaxID=1392490 RepID=UPI00047E5F56|nr:DUF5694 domain-containing protein [Sediminibacter sp. Hel_I_10]